MLDPVPFLGALRIIPVTHIANQIAGDSADMLKGHLLKGVIQIDKFAVHFNIQGL